MLESRVLLVRPTAPSGTDGPPRRVADILDATADNLLGTVQRRSPEEWWRRWLLPPAWTVHEADEEPLLFILRRRWLLSPFWNVLDADEQPVGYLRPSAGLKGSVILDRDGCFLAALQFQIDGTDEGAMLDPRGARLATFRTRAGETELSFNLAPDSEPLIRMLLLAAVLQPLAV